MSSYTERSHADWSGRMFRALAIGGVWGVPRTGLIFTRTGEKTLALTAVMPHDPAMTISARELFDTQAFDFREIQRYMKMAGITTTDQTDTFEMEIQISE